MSDDDVRTALQRHWAASDANDFAVEHQIYEDHAVLEYPQSGERIRGRQRIQASRMAQPNKKRFAVRRMLGGGGLWISELVLTYDEQPGLRREHHGIRGRQGGPGDAIFRRSVPARSIARPVGRTDGVRMPLAGRRLPAP